VEIRGYNSKNKLIGEFSKIDELANLVSNLYVRHGEELNINVLLENDLLKDLNSL